jgi:hypothetical protein
MSADLIKRVLAKRESWVDLGDGKRVKVRRPPAGELYQFRAGAKPDTWLRCCIDWEGFTEAVVLGPELGSGNTAVPFDAELWVVLALDQPEWMAKVASSVIDSINAEAAARDQAGKNSEAF